MQGEEEGCVSIYRWCAVNFSRKKTMNGEGNSWLRSASTVGVLRVGW